MEQSSSWEDTTCAAGQEIPNFLWNTRIHYHTNTTHNQARLIQSASSHLNYLRAVCSHIHKSVLNMTAVSACLYIHSSACLHTWKILTCTRFIFFLIRYWWFFAKIIWHMPVLVETVQQQTLYMKTYVHLYCFGYWGHQNFLWLPCSSIVPVFLWLVRLHIDAGTITEQMDENCYVLQTFHNL
jgi:hypothetical protein